MAKVNVLTDVKVEIDPPRFYGWYRRTVEQRAAELEEWARDFEKFVRDHRSQDPVSLSVIRVYEDQCSHCHSEWETDAVTSEPLCCTAASDEWAAQQEAAA